jgi:hypothetical protein
MNSQIAKVETFEPTPTEVQVLAIRLKAQMLKILKPHNKELKKYLQCAEYPPTYALDKDQSVKLFGADEIERFLAEKDCLPLDKLVVLAAAMNRNLVVKIHGVRNAQIPIVYTDQPDDFVSQLWLSVYGVMALLENGFEKCLAAKKKKADSEIEDRHCEAISFRGVTDCRTPAAILAAARYRGFDLTFDLRRPR